MTTTHESLSDRAIRLSRAVREADKKVERARSEQTASIRQREADALRSDRNAALAELGAGFLDVMDAAKTALICEDYEVVSESARNYHLRAAHDGRCVFLCGEHFGGGGKDWVFCRTPGTDEIDNSAKEKGRVYVAVREKAARKRELYATQ